MEGISAQVYKGLKKYWNRRGYVRLNNNERKSRARAALGEGQPDPKAQKQGKRRRFWRVKISPRIRVWNRVGSPRRWLTRLRDAYVNMMLKISGTGVVGGASGYGGSVGYGYGYGKGQLKEYDEKVIVEIYKSLVIAQGHLVTRGGNNSNSNSNSNSNGNSNDDGKITGSSQHRISISAR